MPIVWVLRGAAWETELVIEGSGTYRMPGTGGQGGQLGPDFKGGIGSICVPQSFGSEDVELQEPGETLETGANAAILRNRPVGGAINFCGRGSSFTGPL